MFSTRFSFYKKKQQLLKSASENILRVFPCMQNIMILKLKIAHSFDMLSGNRFEAVCIMYSTICQCGFHV